LILVLLRLKQPASQRSAKTKKLTIEKDLDIVRFGEQLPVTEDFYGNGDDGFGSAQAGFT
jgi:hypothetical protein